MSKYTKESPTVDGYYWWRAGPKDDDPEIVFVSGGEVSEIGRIEPWEMKNHQGEWIGPLSVDP